MTATPLDQATADYSAADSAYTTAEAAAETARVKAKAAADAATEADRVRMAALAEKMSVVTSRDADVHRQIATVATARIQDAAADQTAALAEFRAAVAASTWGAALVKWMHARNRARSWDLKQVGSLRALGQPVVDSPAQYEAGPTLPGDELAQLLAKAIIDAALVAVAADDATLNAARTAYIDGTSDDPTPPAGT